ncbi:MAG: DUF6261 family protein [Tannerella sp.]|nr:DUF6261 family protein [Tannerella sp.]
MNSILNVIHTKTLPNGTYYTFARSFTNGVAEAPDIVALLGNDYVEYNLLEALVEQHLEWVNKSPDTELIVVADKRLDAAITGLTAQTNAATRDLDPVRAESARLLLVMLKNYRDAVRKAYDDEIASANAILNHLNGDCSAYVTMLGFNNWTVEIQTSLEELVSLIAHRDAHNAQKPESNVRDIRKQMDIIYHRMVKKINSAAILGNMPSVFTLITKLNPEIDRLNAQYHHAKYDIAACEPAPIKQQVYTGQPVTPMPDVLYVTEKSGTVKLELGKDYNLSYKNNVNVGNAECTITGKAKYRGKKTVTFIIART